MIFFNPFIVKGISPLMRIIVFFKLLNPSHNVKWGFDIPMNQRNFPFLFMTMQKFCQLWGSGLHHKLMFHLLLIIFHLV